MTPTNKPSIWSSRSNHGPSAVLRRFITPMVDTEQTYREWAWHQCNENLGEVAAWGLRPQSMMEKKMGMGSAQGPTRGQVWDTLSFDKISGNLPKRGYRALMCWMQEPRRLVAPESDGVCVCVCVMSGVGGQKWGLRELGGVGRVCHLEAMSPPLLWEAWRPILQGSHKLKFWKCTSLDQRERKRVSLCPSGKWT